MKAYTICEAKDFGYYVIEKSMSRHEEVPISCAGTLNDCLDYVRVNIEGVPLDPAPGSIRMMPDDGKIE